MPIAPFSSGRGPYRLATARAISSRRFPHSRHGSAPRVRWCLCRLLSSPAGSQRRQGKAFIGRWVKTGKDITTSSRLLTFDGNKVNHPLRSRSGGHGG
jgi:hypothetical protein